LLPPEGSFLALGGSSNLTLFVRTALDEYRKYIEVDAVLERC
jgi:ATP-dependent Clp protease ATP-binding subunit ClpA